MIYDMLKNKIKHYLKLKINELVINEYLQIPFDRLDHTTPN